MLEFISTLEKDKTPTPFAELRVTIYTEGMVGRDVYKKLIDEVARLAWYFYSLRVAVVQHKVAWSPSTRDTTIMLRYTGKMYILAGYERNIEVSKEEMAEHIAMNINPYFAYLANPRHWTQQVLRNYRAFFKVPIYNAIFYERDGTVKREYNHWEIENQVIPMSVTFTRSACRRGVDVLCKFKVWKKEFDRLGVFP